MCHNEKTQPLDKGSVYELDDIVARWRKNPLLKGITLSGGEPFLQPKACLYLAKKALEDNLDIFIYSGYYYEELRQVDNPYVQELLDISTYLVDGPFEHKIKNLNLLFRGSANQRIICLQETKKENKLVLYNEN
ncbi:Anaerobic ribonucleoside-triphosphate reductase-activating protein [Alteracholeplasma palmae J233]|uniref:Anaerobic ribonucleoside-triphosphate reductase-activating protein n=2 Tax=Acholeplasma palmae TaxID=38986 RepID=U4KJW1_ALTPJ|nr:Anaerobic ribonucleoside-triphosphate reductase-activating protein [Alteracholeplasma palmae J233]